MGQVGAILAGLQPDRVWRLVLRRGVLELRLPHRWVRLLVGPKFLLVDFLLVLILRIQVRGLGVP